MIFYDKVRILLDNFFIKKIKKKKKKKKKKNDKN